MPEDDVTDDVPDDLTGEVTGVVPGAVPGTGTATIDTVPGGRADRRRQRRRRNRVLAIGAGTVAVVAVVAAAVVVSTSGGDEAATRARSGPVVSSTSTSTTSTSTLPVATTAVPRSSSPVVALAQQYDGRYVGTFANTTFATTGPASLELRVDPATGAMAIDADFDGDIFGGGAKEPRRISGTISIGDPAGAVTTQTKAFGSVTGQLDSSLALVLNAPDVPDPKVRSFQLTGRLRADNTGFDATYTVTFEDGTTAQGTVTLGCDPQGTRGSEVTTICPLG